MLASRLRSPSGALQLEMSSPPIDTVNREVVACYPGQASQDIRISPDGTRFIRQNEIEPPGVSGPSSVGPPIIADFETGKPIIELEGVWGAAS